MSKENRLNFRVDTELKEKIENIARKEGRSTAQICEGLLRASLELYDRQGIRVLQRFFSRADHAK